jgi:hypothetical protein
MTINIVRHTTTCDHQQRDRDACCHDLTSGDAPDDRLDSMRVQHSESEKLSASESASHEAAEWS